MALMYWVLWKCDLDQDNSSGIKQNMYLAFQLFLGLICAKEQL